MVHKSFCLHGGGELNGRGRRIILPIAKFLLGACYFQFLIEKRGGIWYISGKGRVPGTLRFYKERKQNMKTKIILPMIVLCFLLIHVFADSTITTDELRQNLTGHKTNRSSGQGIYIRTVYKKAVTRAEAIGGKEFEDEQQKQAYLNRFRAETGIDFSLQQDQWTYTLEKVQFDREKMRRDYADLSETMVNSILNDPEIIQTVPLKTFLFDGQKTMSLQELPRPDGGSVHIADIMSDTKIYFPKFYDFSRTAEEDFSLLNNLEGSSVIRRSEANKQIHNELEMANGAAKMKWVFETDKKMSISYQCLTLDYRLRSETISEDFVKTAGGEWYPQKQISNKYAFINGENVLISMERFESIPNSVDFNISIDPSVFSPLFPAGTEVTDFRQDPPLTYKVETPK
jgi:hypothetical protein